MPEETGSRRRHGGTTEDPMTHAARAILPPIAAPRHPGGATGPALWSTFWRDCTADNVPHERCYVPGDGRQVVDGHWALFADALPPGAHILDLACGAGIVGSTLLSRRSDLRVTGIDWAEVPAAPVPNLVIHPWVSMEELPFGDASFDAAVSLFGIEYGDLGRTARELERVLKAGAPFSFLVHHCDSEILREGGRRRRAVRDALSGKMKAAFLAGDRSAVDHQRQRLAAQFPGEPTVALLIDHFRRHLARTRAEREALWRKLQADFAPEIELLGHLERSAKSAADLGRWATALLSAMRLVSLSVLRRASGEPIAWAVNGIR